MFYKFIETLKYTNHNCFCCFYYSFNHVYTFGIHVFRREHRFKCHRAEISLISYWGIGIAELKYKTYSNYVVATGGNIMLIRNNKYNIIISFVYVHIHIE